MRILVCFLALTLLAACGSVTETAAPTAPPVTIDALTARLAEYGGKFPAMPDDAIVLTVKPIRENTRQAGDPTIFVLTFQIPDSVRVADIEIRSYFARPVSIIFPSTSWSSHGGNQWTPNNGDAIVIFHGWSTNTNIVVWEIQQPPGEYSVALSIQDYWEPTTPAPDIVHIDAFYRPR